MGTTARRTARIIVVDDHPIVRLGVRHMISANPGLSICGEAENLESTIPLIETTGPDLAIIDLSLAKGTSLDSVLKLRETFPKLPLLVLSMHDESLYCERALRAGARGYIMKQEAISGLVAAIHQVLSGNIYVSGRMSQRLLDRLNQGKRSESRSGRLSSLTDRELEVFELIGRGLSTSAIAERLSVSVKTIETYRGNIKIKLNIEGSHDLIRHATVWTGSL